MTLSFIDFLTGLSAVLQTDVNNVQPTSTALFLAGGYLVSSGLLCNYRQERGQDEALNHQKFIEWLEYHHHEELKRLIVNIMRTLRFGDVAFYVFETG